MGNENDYFFGMSENQKEGDTDILMSHHAPRFEKRGMTLI